MKNEKMNELDARLFPRAARLLQTMNDLPDVYVAEAAPGGETTARIQKERRRVRVIWRTLAACLALAILAGSLWLFLPLNNSVSVAKYKKSEYYPVIQRLNDLYHASKYKNRFEKLFLSNKNSAIPLIGSTRLDGVIKSLGNYREVTDNQVEGVIEGDLFKATDRYAFYLSYGSRVYSYEIAGDETKAVGCYAFGRHVNNGFTEMYLTEDGSTLLLIGNQDLTAVEIVALDVRDPADMKEIGRVSVAGLRQLSRLKDGSLLMLMQFGAKYLTTYDDPAQYVPQITTADGTQLVPMDHIYYPDKLSGSTYSVAYLLDAHTLTLKDSTALLNYTTGLYVSADALYATRQYTEKIGQGKETVARTEIVRVCYDGEALTPAGSVTLEGYAKDQYQFDEYEGVLRVALTTQTWGYDRISFNASLYCVDVETMQVRAAVEKFAPENETVRSARFDGAKAYICTAVRATDPVFCFDLSDLDGITYKNTGEIDGYSTSLVQFTEGYLVGIGIDKSEEYGKIEVYREGEDSVQSTDVYAPGAYFPDQYKAYLIDRENGYIGFCTGYYTKTAEEKDYTWNVDYVLLQLADGKLTERLRMPLWKVKGKSGSYEWTEALDLNVMRLMLDGDYLYLFAGLDGLVVYNLQSDGQVLIEGAPDGVYH